MSSDTLEKVGRRDTSNDDTRPDLIPMTSVNIGLFVRIAAGYGTTPDRAAGMVYWLKRGLRSTDNNDWQLTNADMATDEYQLFARIFPHGALAESGSTADAIEALVTNRDAGDTGIYHLAYIDKDGDTEQQRCNIYIQTFED